MTISALAGTCKSLLMLLTTSVRLPRNKPANAYSDNVSGTGVTAPSTVAGSAPKATVTGNFSPGWASHHSRISNAPPRCANQRMMTLFLAIFC